MKWNNTIMDDLLNFTLFFFFTQFIYFYTPELMDAQLLCFCLEWGTWSALVMSVFMQQMALFQYIRMNTIVWKEIIGSTVNAGDIL